MKVHEITISMIADNGLMPTSITFKSPKRTICGVRVRIGWICIRIGARILYGKEWESRLGENE